MSTKIIALGMLGLMSILIAEDLIKLESEKSWF